VHSVKAWVDGWKSRALDVNVFTSIESRPLTEKGIVGLWAVRIATHENVKTVSPYYLAQFLFDAFEIKVGNRALDRALEAESKKGNGVIRLDEHGVKYQVNPAGAQYAEELVGYSTGKAPESVPSNEADTDHEDGS